jgi:ATP-binding cassette subfamily F protein uup
MALISAVDLRLAFGGRPLLEGASLQIEHGERVGLVGRNGEGKTTLLRVLSGDLVPDAGAVVLESGARVALLEQRVPPELHGSVEDVIHAGSPNRAAEAHAVERVCSLLDLDPGDAAATLSGGQKRRALLGRALISEPDLLLLDEPTNHLDLASIEWLEGFLARFGGSLFFVTHDRAFLARLATRIVELDRGRLTSWACDYTTFLRRKEEARLAEERAWALQDRTLAREEEWIRQGIKARRTRNEGRVRALERLREERAARRERVGQAKVKIQQAERSGTRVLTARDVDFGYGDRLLLRGFSTTIVRGDRVGIIGPNGSGKTTLINLLLGRIAPLAGTTVQAEGLQVAYFDQHRAELDDEATVVENLGAGGDWVTIDGARRHVIGYLGDFLFSPERAKQPVSALSGGERNRLLLARLFTRPANLLVLDEPTNDLDAETLELLESLLLEYAGTVLVVSHDRSFLDNLCTSSLVFEGDGVVAEYAGGYSDWKRVLQRRAEERVASPGAKPKAGAKPDARGAGKGAGVALADGAEPRRLTWSERRELEGLPERIQELETRLQTVHETMAGGQLYRGGPEAVRKAAEEEAALTSAIETAFQRWAELSEREG